MSKKVYVIGGGASGFFCAVNLARLHPEYSVTILEKTGKLLSKVLVSGGGRCNATHHCFENPELVKNYPRGSKELKGIFSRFDVTDTVKWFAERGVELHTEQDGRMFPTSNSSQTIIDCFLNEAKRYKVIIKTNSDVRSLKAQGDKVLLELVSGGTTNVLESDAVVVACGGFPMKRGFSFLEHTGHSIIDPIPSLYTFNLPEDPITQLMGLSMKEVNVKIAGTKFSYTGPFLITHWGFSGPAVLKLSAFAAEYFHSNNYYARIIINWLNIPQEELRIDLLEKIDRSKKILPKNSNFYGFPKRLWEFLLLKAEINESFAWDGIARKKVNKLIEILTADVYEMKGKTTFKEEFVTCGGIPLNEVDCKTMQSKFMHGLYFTGEVLNIDGITGGFNFQAAWSTAWIAANTI